MKPTLPPILGARFVCKDEATAAYESMGFRLPNDGAVRCLIPNRDADAPGMIAVWSGKEWCIESGGLSGLALRAWRRFAFKAYATSKRGAS